MMSLCCLLAFAQGKSVTGTVTDPTGEPLIGVSVQVKGAKQGAITDFDGNFKLANVPEGSTLVFSYIGYVTEEARVGAGNAPLKITLREDAQSLEEVVVIGYGSVKKKDITGSVATVDAEALVAVPVASAVEALQGKLAGVQITTTEGSPDAEMKIRVRGGGSITQSNDPLYIVDGFPVDNISDIPTTDIEDITVLKDASSTAIYGSRGANGVIIVTTKSGQEGKISVNYNAYISVKKLADKLDVLKPADYAKWQYELALLGANSQEPNPSSYTKFFGNYQDIDLYDDIESNDWQDIIFGRTGTTFNHSLSVNGGSDKMKFSFNYSHMDDKAIMQMSDFVRDNLSLKLNVKPTKNTKLDFSVRYAKRKVSGGGMNEQNEYSSSDSRLKNAVLYTPFPVAGLSDDSMSDGETDPDFNLYHPMESISDNDRRQRRETWNINGSFTWEIFKNFQFKTEFGWDTYDNDDNRFYGLSTSYVREKVTDTADKQHPAIILTGTERNTFRNTNTLSYDFEKLFAKDSPHHLNMMVGQEYIIKKEREMTNTVHGFPLSFDADDCFSLTTQGHAYAVEDYYSPNDILFSWFGRVNYDYDSKYLFSATFRADGSSKFGEGNRWGYFPSAALAWRISAEPFMEGTRSWLDDLKLRFSYGTAGNNNIPSGQIVQTWQSVSTNIYVNGITSYWAPSKTMYNPDLKWETTITRNLGLDYTLFGGRLNGSLEYYWNTTKDLLIQFPTAGTGYDTQYRNLGKTENRGFEATVNWVAVNKPNFGLNFNANISFNKSEIKSLGIMNDFTAASGWSSRITGDYLIAVGGEVGQMYGYRNDGRYEVSDFTGYNATTGQWELRDDVVDSSPIVGTLRPGSMKLKDLTGEGVVNAKDQEVIGNANPVHTGGFGMNMRIYDFDLSANFNWSYGNDVYNANKIEYTSTDVTKYRNMTTEMADGKRWTNLNPDGTLCNDPEQLAAMNANTTMWSPYMQNYVFTDWAVEDGSFLRLSTLTLGYSLPKSLLSKVKIQNLRFYVTGYNLFCWTNYSGYDPEVSTRRKTNLTPGVDYSAYPKSRSFVFGLNLNF